MSLFTRRLIGLCLPAVLVWSVDCTLTLCGQSEAYWADSRTRHTDGITSLHHYSASVNEVGPTSHYLLALHPLAIRRGNRPGHVGALCDDHAAAGATRPHDVPGGDARPY
jgi:hypothetical protein